APDEAHYWDWSRHLDWSYYSKGPLVAYLIRAGCALAGSWSERLAGSDMLAVRLAAVLCGSLPLVSLSLLTVPGFGRRRLAPGGGGGGGRHGRDPAGGHGRVVAHDDRRAVRVLLGVGAGPGLPGDLAAVGVGVAGRGAGGRPGHPGQVHDGPVAAVAGPVPA